MNRTRRSAAECANILHEAEIIGGIDYIYAEDDFQRRSRVAKPL